MVIFFLPLAIGRRNVLAIEVAADLTTLVDLGDSIARQDGLA